jgi:hypothetical protein
MVVKKMHQDSGMKVNEEERKRKYRYQQPRHALRARNYHDIDPDRTAL